MKPIDMDEMVLRVGALLRRANIANENRLEIGSLALVKDEMGAYLDGVEVPISAKEFNVLYKLLVYPKKIFTRSELIDEGTGGLKMIPGCEQLTSILQGCAISFQSARILKSLQCMALVIRRC